MREFVKSVYEILYYFYINAFLNIKIVQIPLLSLVVLIIRNYVVRNKGWYLNAKSIRCNKSILYRQALVHVDLSEK